MPELMIDFITSLDGYGAAEGWPGFWGMEGPEYLAWLGDQPESEHTILMGANTYRLMHALRATAGTIEPTLRRVQMDTLRLRLLKVAALVVTSVRRVVVRLPRAFPLAAAFTAIARQLGAT